MSQYTLTHDAFYAIPDGASLQAEARRQSRSVSYVVGLMLFLVFAPMLAVHFSCRMSATEPADMTAHRTLLAAPSSSG